MIASYIKNIIHAMFPNLQTLEDASPAPIADDVLSLSGKLLQLQRQLQIRLRQNHPRSLPSETRMILLRSAFARLNLHPQLEGQICPDLD